MDTYDIYGEMEARYLGRNIAATSEEAIRLAENLGRINGTRYQLFITKAGTDTRHIVAHILGASGARLP